MAKKQKYNLRVPEWVLQEAYLYGPESRQVFEQDYLSMMFRVQERLGALATTTASAPGRRSANGLTVAILSAAYATQIMETSNFRAWAPASTNPLLEFQRLTWFRVATVGLGQLHVCHSWKIPRNQAYWHPFKEDLGTIIGHDRAPVRRESNLLVDPASMELALALSLYPDILAKTQRPAIGLALVDSYSDSPGVDNPIFTSIRRGIRKAIHKHELAVPEYWMNWIRRAHPALRDELDAGARLPAPEVPESAISEDHQTQPTPSIEIIQAAMKRLLERGGDLVNCAGAIMHRADRFYLAWPAAYDRWAAQIGGVEGASVARMAVNQGWVEGDTEGLPARVKLPIVKPLTGKSVGIFHGTALTAEGEGALLPHRLFPVNPDIQFKTETQTVDGK